MSTYAVNTLLTNASTLLQDPSNVRWPLTELLQWMNDGQREIASYKPNAFIKNVAVVTVAGTKQTLPADGISLLDIVRNMGTSAVPGNAIRLVSREILDSQVPGWHALAGVSVFKHYCYTPLDPKTYYLYPPSVGGATAYVDMIYVASPTDAAQGGAITLDDIYAAALLNYVIYRAYSKDAEYAANAQLAGAYYSAFQAQLGAKATAEVISNPNMALGSANPNVVPPGAGK